MSTIPFKKYVIRSLAIILLLFFLLFVGACVLLWPFAYFNSRESICHANLYYLGYCMEDYYDSIHHLPIFTDGQGNPTLSWRIVSLKEFKEFSDLRLDESWQSKHNWPIIQNLEMDKSFACAFTYPQEKLAAFVALTGEGTAWNEIHEGRKTPQECGDMILIIEIPNPKNHWAEPGDDVTPEEVIKIFTAYKNRKQTFFPPRKHFPNRFYTAWERAGSFDDIENIEELKRRLVIQP